MTAPGYRTPDLASVLRTLAEYAPPSTPQAATVSQVTSLAEYATVQGEEVKDDEYEPSDAIDGVAQEQSSVFATRVLPVGKAPERHEFVAQSIIDSTTITDWPAALRHVMKTVARSDAIMARVKRMINVQHEHERQWWDGRQALLRKQEGRVEGRKKLDDVLRSVGGNVAASSTVTTPEDDIAELRRYDMKVYKASIDMVKAMTAELTNLGVPFFGMKSDVLRTRQKKEVLSGYEGVDDLIAIGNKDKLGEDELMKLQKRMLELLEDLCRE
ncbi:MAG: hypothetical protein M1830_005563 [Pleopsidium flavum]|nr:MAG: hypothetical protein M1830_005563 [Pleopsidium flavum]